MTALRAALLGLLLGLAIASPALATPAPSRQDWENLLGVATPSAELALKTLGPEWELDTDGAEGRHYSIRSAPYAGGIDLFTTPKGETQEVIFYLVEGPLYLESQLERAKSAKSPLTLAEVERWYGKPLERKTSPRTHATTLYYRYQGDRTRGMMFTSFPKSAYLHRIVVSRGAN